MHYSNKLCIIIGAQTGNFHLDSNLSKPVNLKSSSHKLSTSLNNKQNQKLLGQKRQQKLINHQLNLHKILCISILQPDITKCNFIKGWTSSIKTYSRQPKLIQNILRIEKRKYFTWYILFPKHLSIIT